MKKTVKPKVNMYTIISRAVEEGVRYGMYRSTKYSENPSPEYVEEQIVNGVMNALSEVINYDM